MVLRRDQHTGLGCRTEEEPGQGRGLVVAMSVSLPRWRRCLKPAEPASEGCTTTGIDPREASTGAKMSADEVYRFGRANQQNRAGIVLLGGGVVEVSCGEDAWEPPAGDG